MGLTSSESLKKILSIRIIPSVSMIKNRQNEILNNDYVVSCNNLER